MLFRSMSHALKNKSRHCSDNVMDNTVMTAVYVTAMTRTHDHSRYNASGREFASAKLVHTRNTVMTTRALMTRNTPKMRTMPRPEIHCSDNVIDNTVMTAVYVTAMTRTHDVIITRVMVSLPVLNLYTPTTQ